MVFATHSLYSLYNCVQYRAFSHDARATILSYIGTAAMLVYQDNPVGVELFSYVKTFFCSSKFAQMLATRVKTLYRSSSHPRRIGNGYGIGGAKNSIFPTVNRNRKRNGIGNARIRTCSFPFKTLLVLWLLIYRDPFSSPEPPGGLSTRTRRLWGHRTLGLPVISDFLQRF